jgi:ADP-ribose pyrophosphatase YjhB (NUDIX family)
VKPPSVSIIGSFRQHYAEVLAAVQAFAEVGIEVKSPPISTITNLDVDFVRFESDPPVHHSQDHVIQSRTFEQIFASDFVYVVSPSGYIGRTTAWELGTVRERGMAVYYSEYPRDLPLEVPEQAVVDARLLASNIVASGVPPVRRPRVSAQLTADIVIFTIRDRYLRLLLIERKKPPFKGSLALPGGFVRPAESLEYTAERELREETGLDGSSIPLQQVQTYSEPDRDPRGRVVTTAFLAIAPNLPDVIGATDAKRAYWAKVEESLWLTPKRLAFDHADIVQDALEQARRQLEYTTIATAFCSEPFTVGDLREVYEAVWGFRLDKSNFQRKVKSIDDFIVATGEKRSNVAGRPPALYRRGKARVLYPPILRGEESK